MTTKVVSAFTPAILEAAFGLLHQVYLSRLHKVFSINVLIAYHRCRFALSQQNGMLKNLVEN